jgi:Tfp pilus assembly protein PilN
MNWAILRTGIGIDIEGGVLRAVYVKRRWRRVRVIDSLSIPGCHQLGPQECGRRYAEFLRRNGLSAPWTAVALPRSEVLLRSLYFPKAAEAELSGAIEYQLDSLHPFEENSVYWAFSSSQNPATPGNPARDRIEVLVAIVEKHTADAIADWFEQAGIAISQFTVTTAALMNTIQKFLQVQSDAASRNQSLFIWNAGADGIEIAGYAADVGLISKMIPVEPADQHGEAPAAAAERQLGIIRSELRISPDLRPPLIICGENDGLDFSSVDSFFSVVRVGQLFSSLSARARFEKANEVIAVAAGMDAADRNGNFLLNLLPAGRRTYQSPFLYLPTYALGALVTILVLALGMRGTFQDWMYGRYLEQQIRALTPQLQAVDSAQAQSKKAYDRLALLANVKTSSVVPLEILSELTKLLPSDVWIQQIVLDGDAVSLVGYGPSGSQLLQTLASSTYFENPQFTAAISRTADGKEMFRIGVRLKRIR